MNSDFSGSPQIDSINIPLSNLQQGSTYATHINLYARAGRKAYNLVVFDGEGNQVSKLISVPVDNFAYGLMSPMAGYIVEGAEEYSLISRKFGYSFYP